MKKNKISIKLVVIISVTVILAIALTVTGILLSRQADKKSREYSGEETNQSIMLCFDVAVLDKFKVMETRNSDNGIYSEYLIAKDEVHIRIWRDFTRPKMSCRKQISEHYPKLSGYSSQKIGDNDILSERGEFTVKDGEKTYRHIVLLLRREGWDYLVDFAVEKDKFSEFENYINSLADSLFYL